jgi:hypothetical protein
VVLFLKKLGKCISVYFFFKISRFAEYCHFLGFVSPCIIIHSNKSNQPDASSSQIYCSSFIYNSTSLLSLLPDRPQPTTLLPPRSNGKPETATAVYKLLMMGLRTPETCWVVFKRLTINLRDWCIWLVWFIWTITFVFFRLHFRFRLAWHFRYVPNLWTYDKSEIMFAG